jgi:hypothetical protein
MSKHEEQNSYSTLPPNIQATPFGNRWIADVMCLAFGLVLLVEGVLSVHPEQSRQEAALAEEFNAYVGPACVEYEAQLQEAAAELETQVLDGFAELADEFAEICVNSDGFIERSKGEAAAARVLSDSMRASVTEFITRYLADFEMRANDAQELLELRLLLEPSIDSPFASLLKKHLQQIQSYAPQPPTSEIRGGGLGKTIDEGVTWIPILGDAWDVTKLIFGDPRENGIRERARNFVNSEKAKWLTIVTELKESVPDAAITERNCRAVFQPGLALSRLNAQ